jgi:hypothetical protein
MANWLGAKRNHQSHNRLRHLRHVTGLGAVAGTFLAAAVIPLATGPAAHADVVNPTAMTASGPAHSDPPGGNGGNGGAGGQGGRGGNGGAGGQGGHGGQGGAAGAGGAPGAGGAGGAGGAPGPGGQPGAPGAPGQPGQAG